MHARKTRIVQDLSSLSSWKTHDFRPEVYDFPEKSSRYQRGRQNRGLAQSHVSGGAPSPADKGGPWMTIRSIGLR